MSSMEFNRSDWINRDNDPRLHGASSRVPFGQGDSPSRRDMSASQLSQSLVIVGSSIPRIMGPQEKELAKCTHRIVAPFRFVVRDVIFKYPRANFESDVTLVVESIENYGYFDIIKIPHHHCTDPQFGWRYVRTPRIRNVKQGDVFERDELLAHSPNCDQKTGLYRDGLGLQTAFMTSMYGIEDGALFADDLKHLFSTTCYREYRIPFGSRSIGINYFGTKDNYRPLKSVGEYLDDEGIIAITRQLDTNFESDARGERMSSMMGMWMLDRAYLMEYDTSDKVWSGVPGAKIVKMDVIRTHPRHSAMLTGTDEQLINMAAQTLQYHHRMIHAYARIKDPVHGCAEYKLSERLTMEISRAMSMIEYSSPKSPVRLVRGHEELDEFEVCVGIEWELAAEAGAKAADKNGGKVIGVNFIPRHRMPYDAERGVYADMVVLDQATGNRTNPGREVYMAVTIAAERTQFELKQWREDMGESDEFYERAYARIWELYEAVDPLYADDARQVHATEAKRRKHVDKFIKYGLYMATYYDLKMTNSERLRRLRAKFDISGRKVSFVDYDGTEHTTIEDVLIAELHVHILEKTADRSSGTSIPLMTVFGVPANPTTEQKKTSLYYDSACRFFGESEANTVTANTPPGTLAHIYDCGFNINAVVQTAFSILSAPNPMQLDYVVDRNVIPISGGKPLSVATHMLKVSGKAITFRKDKGVSLHFSRL